MDENSTFKVNRLYSMMNLWFFIRFIFVFGIFGVVAYLTIIKNNTHFIVAVPFLLFWGYNSFRNTFKMLPKEFTVKDNSVVCPALIHVDSPRFLGDNSSNKSYTVPGFLVAYKISRIEYSSTKFQQSNRMGNIIIYGKIFEENENGVCYSSSSYRNSLDLYGVKDFSGAVNRLKAQFPDAEHIDNYS